MPPSSWSGTISDVGFVDALGTLRHGRPEFSRFRIFCNGQLARLRIRSVPVDFKQHATTQLGGKETPQPDLYKDVLFPLAELCFGWIRSEEHTSELQSLRH